MGISVSQRLRAKLCVVKQLKSSLHVFLSIFFLFHFNCSASTVNYTNTFLVVCVDLYDRAQLYTLASLLFS